MAENNFITAAIVTYNDSGKALKAVNSLKQNTKHSKLKIFVFDNASKSIDLNLNSAADVFARNDSNLGFGAAHNKILQYEMGKYHAVVNPDITVDSDVISQLARLLDENPDICMVTPKILNADGTEQKLPKRNPSAKYLFLGRLARLGGYFKKVRDEFVRADEDLNDITDIDFCTGCFFMIRSEVFRELGGFDERYFMYLEDADLTRQVRRFGRTVYCPEVSVQHLWERGSAKSLKLLLIHLISFFKYLRKWKNELR